MSSTLAYCTTLDLLRDAPAHDRESFLLDKLRDTLAQLYDAKALLEESDAKIDDARSETDDVEQKANDLAYDLECVRLDKVHAEDGLARWRADCDELAAKVDGLQQRAIAAEEQVVSMRKALRGISVTRRGNVLHVHLPEALHVPAPGWNHPWNTLSVPVVSSREPAAGRSKMVDETLDRPTGTTWLSFSPEREIAE